MSINVPPTPIKLFHLPGSRSERIACLLTELKLPYQLIKPDFSSKTWMEDMRPQIGSLGRFPTIHDTITNESNGEEKIVVCESGAIAEYLLHRYSSPTVESLFPTTPLSDWTKILQYIHIAESTFLEHGIPIRYLYETVPAILSTNLSAGIVTEGNITQITEETTKLFKNKLEWDLVWLENELENQAKYADDGQGLFLVGKRYTVADLMVGQALDLLERRVVSKDGKPLMLIRPRTMEWLDNLRRREAWAETREKCRSS